MKALNLKLLGMALLANLVPIATGIVQILLGNPVTGVGTLAGGFAAASIQVINANAEAKHTRSLVTVRWFFSRIYVWLTIAVSIIVALILFHP
jgi:hypothetical protein